MVSQRLILRSTATAALFALLTACGGGSNDPIVVDAPVTPVTPVTPTPAQQFATDYSANVAALGTTAGLSSGAILDTVDDGFLDAGYTKPAMRSQLAQEAAARATNPDLTFPGVTLSNVTIGACDAAGVCSMTATVTNADADSTSTTFTSRVKLSNSRYRLYGDQTQAPTV
ncbi:hypothetical protein GN316_14225 [Xylophilus sp. Kf1]|nr:hypothetical protein [Xylophilus sp. Kf1]